MKYLLWLDDIRNPHDELWQSYVGEFPEHRIHWVKSYLAFTQWIQFNGLPDVVFFDHDLGEDVAKEKVSNGISKRQARKQKKETLSGYDCAHWLVNYCMDTNQLLPQFGSQSANPVGRENILTLLTNFNKHR